MDDTHKLRIQRTIKALEQRIRKVEAELAEIPDVNQASAATTGTAAGTTCLPWWMVLCVVAVVGGAALLAGGKSDDPPAAVEADALISTAGTDRTSSDHLASDPVPSAGKFFISSGYGRGCALLDTKSGKPVKVWENRTLKNHFSSSVLIDGFLYGIDGNTGKGDLRCIEFNTGDEKWSKSLGFASLIRGLGIIHG